MTCHSASGAGAFIGPMRPDNDEKNGDNIRLNLETVCNELIFLLNITYLKHVTIKKHHCLSESPNAPHQEICVYKDHLFSTNAGWINDCFRGETTVCVCMCVCVCVCVATLMSCCRSIRFLSSLLSPLMGLCILPLGRLMGDTPTWPSLTHSHTHTHTHTHTCTHPYANWQETISLLTLQTGGYWTIYCNGHLTPSATTNITQPHHLTATNKKQQITTTENTGFWLEVRISGDGGCDTTSKVIF